MSFHVEAALGAHDRTSGIGGMPSKSCGDRPKLEDGKASSVEGWSRAKVAGIQSA